VSKPHHTQLPSQKVEHYASYDGKLCLAEIEYLWSPRYKAYQLEEQIVMSSVFTCIVSCNLSVSLVPTYLKFLGS
jgi:hypothetical protein